MRKTLFILFILCSVVVFGEEPVGNIYWIQFNSKANTPYSLNEPEYFLSQRAIARRERQHVVIDSTDLPVNPDYINSLIPFGFYIKHVSRWMNGVIAVLDSSINIEDIQMPSFVKGYELRKEANLKSASKKLDEIDTLQIKIYGNSFKQVSMIRGEELHKVSRGKGVYVAIIDAGFKNSNQLEVFDSIYSRNGVLGTYDFVNPGSDVYQGHYHGNAVFSIMAGNHPGELIGSAPDASYWLMRSEDGDTESPVEEDYWVIAAEYADRLGCDVINTSLGYSTFDNPAFNHTYEQLDGKTLRISQAANLAVEKGIVVVCSAGNSGNDSWGHILAPSEAKDVLSVAAVYANKEITSFSSRGFSEEWALPKPDVAAMGAGVTYCSTSGEFVTGNGTSFSSPIIAGMAACLVAYYPEKTAYEIIHLIRSIGNLYPAHDLEYGYGIPDFSLAIKTENVDTSSTSVSAINNIKSHIYPNPFVNQLSVYNFDGFKTFELFAANGTLMFSENIDGINIEISSPILSGLKKGMYFAMLKGEQNMHAFKLMKF